MAPALYMEVFPNLGGEVSPPPAEAVFLSGHSDDLLKVALEWHSSRLVIPTRDPGEEMCPDLERPIEWHSRLKTLPCVVEITLDGLLFQGGGVPNVAGERHPKFGLLHRKHGVILRHFCSNHGRQ